MTIKPSAYTRTTYHCNTLLLVYGSYCSDYELLGDNIIPASSHLQIIAVQYCIFILISAQKMTINETESNGTVDGTENPFSYF